MARCLTWRTGLVAVVILYFSLAFLCLMYLPNFDGFLRDTDETGSGGGDGSGRPQHARHRHIRVREWLSERCANLTSPTSLVAFTRPVSVKSPLHLMSVAYYDTRKELSHFIRVLAAVEQSRRRDLNLHCHVPLAPGMYFTVPGTPYEMNENHAMPWGAYVFSCALPPHLQVSDSVCSVLVTNGPDPERDLDGKLVVGIELPVLSVPRELPPPSKPSVPDDIVGGEGEGPRPQRQFTVCVPPLFGTVLERRILDFVEMSRALGAEHFVFYLTPDLQATGQTALINLLKSYERRGLATVFQWRAVDQFRSQIHYHGQVLAVHHCLYWNMGLSRYAVFQDFDELLVPNPTKYKSWGAMAKDIDDGSHCGFRFFSAFFEPDQGYFDAKRTAGVSRVRTKCMVRPDLIFEMGIHHISKQNIEEMTPSNKEPDVALLHHYSRCTIAFESGGPELCNKYVSDASLHSWQSDFERLKRETIHALNGSGR